MGVSGILRKGWLPAWACLLMAASALVLAQPAGGNGGDRVVYAASHFAATAPANALDMVLRLPGFGIVEADEDVRGYAGAQGNVLIDGARPASKRDAIDELLKRIPAHSVLRIELIRSAAAGVDMAGFALLANVVRVPAAVSELALQGSLIAATDGWIAPRAALEYGRHRGEQALELALSAGPELDEDTGKGSIVRRNADGSLQQRLDSDARTVNRLSEATASWRQPFAGGSLAINAAARGERVRADEDISDRNGAAIESVDETEADDEAEFGLRYVRRIGDRTTLEAIASEQRGWLDARSHSLEGDEEERFDERTRSGERIVRASLTREHNPQLSLIAGLEAALNFLQSDARLVQDGAIVELPGSDIRIEEQRVEASLAASWRPRDDWTFESGLRIERSQLDQTGDSPLQRAFVYPKPRFSALWKPDDVQQWRASLTREVGQLDFDDFVASAALDTGVISAGNAQLEPDKTWRAALAWERRFGSDGAVGLTLSHDRISDVVDRVAVVTNDDIFDAPGNIGSGRRNTLALEAGSSLQSIGLADLRVSGSVLWQRSRVIDPTTGATRPISKESPVAGTLSLVHALPARGLSWGVDVTLAITETKYGIDEIARKREGGSWTLFAEQRLGDAWRLRGELSDAGGRRYSDDRRHYDGLRGLGPPDELERREHRYPGTLMLSLRRNVGG